MPAGVLNVLPVLAKRYVSEIDGYDEAAAKTLFASSAQFMLACEFASLIIDLFFAGILSVQVYRYYKYQPDDARWVKIVVGWVAFMNFVISCFNTANQAYLFCTHFGEWLPWLEVRWLMMMPTFDILTVSVVQGFFARRAFVLNNRNKPLLIAIWVCIVTAAAGGLGTTIVFGRQKSLLGATQSGPVLILWAAAATAADLIITVSILWALMRSKTGWAHTDRTIGRWVRLTFESQIPPALLALAYVIEWSITPSSLLGGLLAALEGKAYGVSLLFSLNARINLSAVNESGRDYTSHKPRVFGLHSRGQVQPTEIHVNVETEAYVEGGSRKDDFDSLGDEDKDAHAMTQYGSQAQLTHN